MVEPSFFLHPKILAVHCELLQILDFVYLAAEMRHDVFFRQVEIVEDKDMYCGFLR